MREVSSYEAKTKLPELLREVAAGERIIITRRGVPVAELSPIPAPAAKVSETLAKMDALRKGRRLGGVSITELRDEGRR